MFSHLFRRSKVALALLLTWNFSFTYAEDRPDEHLILTDCGIQPNRDSLYRHILYYKGSPWDDHNIPLRAPDMHVDVGTQLFKFTLDAGCA